MIFTNEFRGLWVTASIDSVTGDFVYTKNVAGGTTRIVGVYQDSLVANGLLKKIVW